MTLDVYYKEDIAQGVVSGLYTMLCANRGRDIEFLTGAICSYQQQAALYGLSWTEIAKQVSDLLGVNSLDSFLDNVGKRQLVK